MTELEVKATEYLNQNSGIIDYAPKGCHFSAFPNGKLIKSKGNVVMVTFNGVSYVGRTLELVLVSMKKSGKIDLYQFGYDDCPKCQGTGNTGFNVDGGTCWKCNGFGIIKRK